MPDSLFSSLVKDYSFDIKDLQEELEELHSQTTSDYIFSTQLIDPGSHLLRQQSPIQTPRNSKKVKRDLPSPSNAQSGKNGLLLSHLQELKKKDFLQRQQEISKAI